MITGNFPDVQKQNEFAINISALSLMFLFIGEVFLDCWGNQAYDDRMFICGTKPGVVRAEMAPLLMTSDQTAVASCEFTSWIVGSFTVYTGMIIPGGNISEKIPFNS